MDIGVVILAAGQGSRMKSALPKVMHPLAGKPMLRHVIDTGQALGAAKCVVVYGHGGEYVRDRVMDPGVEWALQEEQLGTGHAVMQAMPLMENVDRVLILYGDVPLIRAETLQHLIDASAQTALGMLTVTLDDAAGYGRIVRDEEGAIQRIVEHKDATPEELALHEVNVGMMLVDRQRLAGWLARLDSKNVQSEYYLTDIIGMAVSEGEVIASVQPRDAFEVAGVNDRAQLARLERSYQASLAETLMASGVTLADPLRIDIRGHLSTGRDVSIDINTIFEGEVNLGDNVRVGANCVLRNCTVAANTLIHENCVIENSVIGEACRIGPFARIRPGTELSMQCHVGNFVELKNAQVADGSKINHLSYVGDASVGEQVNIGAGTITCNYDGAYKQKTVIEDDVFVGSSTQLVAPVTVKKGATIGAGSTITSDAPEDALTLSRAKQRTIRGWKRPRKGG